MSFSASHFNVPQVVNFAQQVCNYNEHRVSLVVMVWVNSPPFGVQNPNNQWQSQFALNKNDHGDAVKQAWMFYQTTLNTPTTYEMWVAPAGPVDVSGSPQAPWIAGMNYGSGNTSNQIKVTAWESFDDLAKKQQEENEVCSFIDQITGKIFTKSCNSDSKKRIDPALYLQTAAMLRDARKDDCRCKNGITSVEKAILALERCGS